MMNRGAMVKCCFYFGKWGVDPDFFLLVEIANEEVLKNLLKIQEVGGLMISSNFAVIITPANKVDEIKKVKLKRNE